MNESYFSHDAHSRNDPKCAALIQDRGMAGYGMWWVTVEMLRREKSYKLKNTPLTWLALSGEMSSPGFVVSPDDVRAFIVACVETYELLVADDSHFWSESLLRRMRRMEDVSKKRARAGLASAAARWQGDEDVPGEDGQQVLSKRKTGAGKRKKKKQDVVSKEVGGTPKVKYRDKVNMTGDEYQRLVNAYGVWFTEKCLDKLDAWKDSKRRTTHSDYKAILLWVTGAVQEDINRGRIVQPKKEVKPSGSKYGGVGAKV